MNKYDRIQAQNDVDKNKDALSKLEAEKAYNKLSDAEKAKYKTVEDYYNQNKDYFYYVAVDEQLKTNRENNKNLGGMGSDVSKGIDSAISIVTGIITGDITGGLAGASAPWVAEQIKIQTGDNETARLISHAILGAVVAELQGNSGLAGGAGAVTGELAADIIREQLYGKKAKDLTEAEKENISALAQLATGLAVASVGGDVGDVSTGIAAGKNAVENNFMQSTGGGNFELQAGFVDYAGSAQEVVKELEFKCGNNCTPDDYREAFEAAGIINRFDGYTEEQRKAIYMLPLFGIYYGGVDAIKERDIRPLLEAGLSQTEIGGIIMMVYRNRPNVPTESEVLLRIENIANKGKDKAGKGAAGHSVLTHFPENPNDLSKIVGVDPKITTTQHGTTRMVWEPNSNTRIRYESHPGDSGTFNPRHHGEHYHIEIKPDNLTWNQAKRQNAIQKVKPEDYQVGHGTGFLPGEKHPGQ